MFNVVIGNYNGPFDLILDLISKKKLDICNISIIDIINDFVNYIQKVEMNSEEQGEFLLVASRLLEIKSKYLLSITSEEDDDESIEKFVNLLELYKKNKELSLLLRDREHFYGDLYKRKPMEQYITETISLENLNVDLFLNNLNVLKKSTENKLVEIKNKKIISVEDKISIIQRLLKSKNKLFFTELLENEEKDDSVAALLSILELAKVNEIGIMQYDLFNEIIIEGK